MNVRTITAVLALSLAIPCFAGTKTRISAFEYDPVTGKLNKEIIEPLRQSPDPDFPNAANYYPFCLVTEYAPDSFGNITSATTRNCDQTLDPIEAPKPAATDDATFALRIDTTTYGATTADPVPGQFPTASTNALKQPESRSFDTRFGTLTSLTGPNNLITSWTLDSFGRKIKEARADGTSTTWDYQRCADIPANTCPPLGQYRVLVTMRAADTTTIAAPITSIYYDSLNREIRVETQGFDGTLIFKDTQYDSLGRVAQISRPYYSASPAVWTVFTSYDLLGRVTQIDEPPMPSLISGQPATVRATTVTAYNGLVTMVTNSNTGSTAGLPNNVTQSKTTTRNSQGQVVQVKDALNNALNYTYDEFGNPHTTTDALGNVIALTYDQRGRKTQMTDPDMGTWNYFYDALGELKRQVDAKQQTTTVTYDLIGRIKTRSEPDLVGTWTYDTCFKGIGKLCQVSADNSFSRSYGYDSLGRPSTVTTTIGTAYTVTKGYDSASRLSTLTYPSGVALLYEYKTTGYLQDIRDNSNLALLWAAQTLSATGKVTQELLGSSGVSTNRLYYEAQDALRSVVTIGPAGTVQNSSYTYDALGNLTDRTDNFNSVTEHFTYDELNRFKMASGTGSSSALVTRATYYDAIGNITSKSDASTTIPGGVYTYPPSGAGSVRPHAVSSITGTVNGVVNPPPFTYDPNGNLTSGLGRTLSYTSFNMPLTFSQGSNSFTYTYGANHERMRVVLTEPTGTTEIDYVHPDGSSNLLFEQEFQPGGVIEYRHYVTGSAGLIGAYVRKSTDAPGTHPIMKYYLRDQIQSVAAVMNDAGASTESFGYEAFGKRRIPNGTPDPNNTITVVTHRGFTTHEHLDDLQLIHMNGRVYDPLLGRFTSADPMIQDAGNLQAYNRYSYAANNPLTRSDPSGFNWRSRFRNFYHTARQYDPLSNVLVSIHGALHGDLAEVMQGSNHAISPETIFGDRFIRNHPSVAPYVEIVEGAGCTVLSYFTYYIVEAACSAGVSAYNTGLLGGSNQDILTAGATSFATAYISVDTQNSAWYTRALVRGVAGGVATEMQGGQFSVGFEYAAGFSLAESAATALAARGVEADLPEDAKSSDKLVAKMVDAGIDPTRPHAFMTNLEAYFVGPQANIPDWGKWMGRYIPVVNFAGLVVDGLDTPPPYNLITRVRWVGSVLIGVPVAYAGYVDTIPAAPLELAVSRSRRKSQ